MADIPTFSNEDPVINSVGIVDQKSGAYQLSKIVSNATDNIINKAISAKKMANQSMFYSKSQDIAAMRRDAVASIYQNPGNAQQISKITAQNIMNFAGNIKIGDDYDKRLKALASNQISMMNEHALLASGRFHRQQVAANLQVSVPDAIRNARELYIKDPEQGSKSFQSISDNIKNAYEIGAITPTAYRNMEGSISTEINRIDYLQNQIKNNGSHQSLHFASTWHDNQATGNLPIKGDTLFKYSDNNNSLSLQQVEAEINRGIISSSIFNLSNKDFNSFQLYAKGVKTARASINYGEHYDLLRARMKQLDNIPASSLTIEQKGEKDHLDSFFSEINNGQMMQALGRTSAGKNILDNHNSNQESINNNGTLTSQQKADLTSDNLNGSIRKIVSLANSLGIPSGDIKPMSLAQQQSANNIFDMNRDPSTGIAKLNIYSKDNAVYFADSVKNRTQQETLNIVNNLRGLHNENFSIKLITANQTGRSYADINYPSGESIRSIKSQIASANSDIFQYLNSLPGGAQRVNHILDALTNTVLFDAQKSNDLNLNNLSNYVNDVSSNYAKSMNLIKGNNFIINSSRINITQQQASSVANYLINQLKSNMSKNNNNNLVNQYSDLTPMHVISTDDGYLIVINSLGEVMDSPQLYTKSLQAMADKHSKTTIKNSISDDIHQNMMMSGIL